jgi:hypothetical protein
MTTTPADRAIGRRCRRRLLSMLRFAGDEAPPNSQPLDGAPTRRRGLRRLAPVARRVRRGVARRATNGGTARRHARPVPKTTPARRDARETVPANAFEAAAGALRSTAPMLRVISCASTAFAAMHCGSCGRRSRSTDPGIPGTQGARSRSGHGDVEYDVLGFGFNEISPEDRQPHSPSTRGSTAGRDRPQTRTIAQGDQALANGFRRPRA